VSGLFSLTKELGRIFHPPRTLHSLDGVQADLQTGKLAFIGFLTGLLLGQVLDQNVAPINRTVHQKK